jgi:flagellar motor protein MotB
MIVDEADEHVIEEENYFISMTDMMVGLVFIFIIMLMYYALQFRDVTDQLSGADQTRAQILLELKQSLKSKGVIVDIDPQNGVLRLPDAILFDRGDDALKKDGERAVESLAQALWEIVPCYSDVAPGVTAPMPKCNLATHRIESLYIEGHTDIDFFSGGHGLSDNWDLSAMRATNTYRALVRNQRDLEKLCAMKASDCEPILSVSGYGPQRPLDRATSDEAKKKNRRIDLRIIMIKPDSGETAQAIAKHLPRR